MRIPANARLATILLASIGAALAPSSAALAQGTSPRPAKDPAKRSGFLTQLPGDTKPKPLQDIDPYNLPGNPREEKQAPPPKRPAIGSADPYHLPGGGEQKSPSGADFYKPGKGASRAIDLPVPVSSNMVEINDEPLALQEFNRGTLDTADDYYNPQSGPSFLQLAIHELQGPIGFGIGVVVAGLIALRYVLKLQRRQQEAAETADNGYFGLTLDPEAPVRQRRGPRG